MKIRCRSCLLNKPVTDFYRSASTSLGYEYKCKICRRVKALTNYASNRDLRMSQMTAYNKKYKAYINNAILKNYYLKRDSKLAKMRKYSQSNRELFNFYNAKRRAMKLKATLNGFDDKINKIYLNRPKGCHVDHIIPLVHKDVCGLHVPWNLQYLPAIENLRKGNRL